MPTVLWYTHVIRALGPRDLTAPCTGSRLESSQDGWKPVNIVSKVPEIIKLCVDVIKVTYPIGIRVKERNRINGLFPPDMLILYHGSKSKQLSHRLEKTTRSNSETMELVYNELDGTRENEMSEHMEETNWRWEFCSWIRNGVSSGHKVYQGCRAGSERHVGEVMKQRK